MVSRVILAANVVWLIQESFQKLPDSIIAHRIAAEIYEQDEDYENALKVCENGIELAQRSEKNTCAELPKYEVNIIVGGLLFTITQRKESL